MSPKRPENVSSQDWFQQIPQNHATKGRLRPALAEYHSKYTPAQIAAYEQSVAHKKLVRAQQTTERLVHGPKKARNTGPKKPATSWQLFMMDFRASQSDEVKRDMTQVAALASTKWKSMSDADKAPYVKKAERLREQFKIDQAKVQG
ncbi:hypothetical protein BCR44DRAFT_1431324 [Catenaria anguillulae PL171]|uniref:HMG box domain-containing protein n=1 Tax=Catenaria anguillulae PL171 TaxID=765915 RepID=A0A1Y2HR13_9FUNG|nr:hypothetical protein BCR44DRAFT_1431324 [Catenaria anguillulae PL171]